MKATPFTIPTKATAFLNYLSYLRDFSQMEPNQIQKNERWIIRIEFELGKPVIEAKTASEINRAIIAAAEKRKTLPNGGHGNEGQDLRFRLGQAVKCFLEWSYSENLIRRNPYPKNPFKRPPVRDAYFIPHEKISLLYNGDLEPLDLAIVRFLIDTGVRISELCSLKREDLYLDNLTATVFMSKVNRMKTVPFSEATKESILKVMGDYVFIGRQGPISPKAVRHRLVKLGKRYGFRMNPHAFRHSAGTMWVKEVGEIPAQKLLGHTSLRQTAHYTHLNKKDLSGYRQKVAQKYILQEA